MLKYLLILFFPSLLLAQKTAIQGQVFDKETSAPMEFASVSLHNAMDSSLLTGTTTDLSGIFILPVSNGAYFVRIQFVTYEMYQTERININNSSPVVNIGKILLAASATELSEVVVQAERTQMELQLDKKVFNVGKDISNLGGSASDMLDNLPSVSVDVDGNVSLRGSSNVRILIDGKPSGLVGLSSSDALRQLQSNLIESVEIITNPSARYDAEGMSGIINIILKKEKQKGVNGSVQVNTGWPHNHGVSFNLNFRRKWANLFANYGVDFREAPGKGYDNQRFTFPDTTYYTDRIRNHTRGGIANNMRFGADFYLSDKSTLTTSFLYRISKDFNSAFLSFNDLDANRDLLRYTLRNDEELEDDNNLEYSVNFTHNFDRKDHKFTADIQYQNNNEIERSDIIQTEGTNESNAVPTLFQKVRNEEGEKRLMLQTDYVLPYGENGKIEAGFRSTWRNIKNIYLVEEQQENGNYIPLDTFSTDFQFDEIVHGIYGITSNEFGKFQWQVGLRAEITDINTRFRETNDRFEWNYINFFPSAFFTYKLADNNQLQLSYSRRINRPRFRDLNPFSSFTDNRNFRVGNPNLQPEFTDSYEVGYLQNLPNTTLYYGAYYRYTTGLIQQVNLRPTEAGLRTTIPDNIGYSNAMGLEMNVTHDFGKWYRVSGNFNLYSMNTRGSVGDSISLQANAFSFSSRLSNNFKVKGLFDAQLNVNYRAPENQTQGRRLAMTVVDLGISRDIWKNKGTITLGVRDMFNSRKWRSITELDNFYQTSEWQWRVGPNFLISLTYRINQKKRMEEKSRPDGEGMGDDF